MTKFILLLLLTLSVNVLAAGQVADKILPYVVTVPFDSPGLAALHIITQVVARNKVEPGVTGFAHFFEHMMFRGTDNYSRDDYFHV